MVQIKALNCPNCGASIPDTSKACSHCGSRVILSDDRQKFVLAGTLCPKCGLDNKEQNRFCSNCGGKLFQECPKCHKEIGLASIYCPSCGENIDNATKQRETELAKHQESLNISTSLQQKIELLQQKMRPLSDEYVRLSNEAGGPANRIDYSDDSELSKGQMFLIIYPLGAAIISVIISIIITAHNDLKGFGDFFPPFFIASYVCIFYFAYLMPYLKFNNLDARRKLISKEIETIQKEIAELQSEIGEHSKIMSDISRRYRS